MGFFRELKQRRLGQIIISYLVAGWATLQIVSSLIDRGVLPGFIYRLGLIWFIGGAFVAVMIGWYHGEKGHQKAPLVEIIGLSVITLAVLGITGVSLSGTLAAHRAVSAAKNGADLDRVAVMYFKDLTPDSSYTYLADGLTESLISELSQVPALDVISRNGTGRYRGTNVSADSVGRALKAGTVVTGTVEHTGHDVRVNVSLLDGQSGAEFQRASFERPDTDVVAIRDQVAKDASRLLRQWLGQEIQLRSAQQGADNNAAWALYERAEKAHKDGEARLRTNFPAAMGLYGAADSLLVQASTLDPKWAAPPVLRARLAYERSRIAFSQDDLSESMRWDSTGQRYANQALALEPKNPHALEMRGTLRYWEFLRSVTMGSTSRQQLLDEGRRDLEAAVSADPQLASAYSTLSHLYYYTDNVPAAVVAAQRAYEQDAYLDVANGVLWRLFQGNADLDNLAQARRWCAEGARRFADDYHFRMCQLELMTTPAEDPDIPRAWALLAAVDSLSPKPRRVYWHVNALLDVGGALARAGMPDSARAVLTRAQEAYTPQVDPSRELFWNEAYMYTLLNQKGHAISLIQQALAANPGHTISRTGGLAWWWRSLENDPRFKQLESK